MDQSKALKVILGAGESGMGAALLARKHGFAVLVSERSQIHDQHRERLRQAGVQFEENGHTLSQILKATEVIKSPGIPNHAPIVGQIMEAGIPVISELEFASRYTRATLVGITGTNGKTTTSLLTYHMLKKAGYDVLLAGNIGNSLSRELLVRDYEYIVLEVSSFQLDNIRQFHPHISVLLNITPDHLSYYEGQFERYVDAKFNICLNHTEEDTLVYNYDDPTIRKRVEACGPPSQLIPFSALHDLGVGASFVNDVMTIYMSRTHQNDPKKDKLDIQEQEINLKGKHNRQNSMAASIVSKVVRVRNKHIRDSLQDFENVEHRLERFARINGVDYINDSKATNVNAAWFALESMNHPVIWICGGEEKGAEYSALIPLVREKVKSIICLGKDNRKLRQALSQANKSIMETDNLSKAVEHALHLAESGDAILLSPACASYDLFDSYQDRGDQFKSMVKRLTGGAGR